MSSVMETHWLVSDPLSRARICQLFHTLSLSLSLSLLKNSRSRTSVTLFVFILEVEPVKW